MKTPFFSSAGPRSRSVALSLCILMILSGCTTVVQIRPPYAEKVRPGDGVKITVSNGTVYTGEITYVDRAIIVIRTPEQVTTKHPVKSARFASTIQWKDVRRVKVSGTLDSRGRLVSTEELRVNTRTNWRRNLAINFGLLGMMGGFLGGVELQDSISPPTTDLSVHRPGTARFAFWSTFIASTLGGAVLGYWLGDSADRRRAIARIERHRAALQTARMDSLLQKAIAPPRPASQPEPDIPVDP